MDLPDYNSTSYPVAVTEQLKLQTIDDNLHHYQSVVVNYFTKSGTRGILVNHDMGLGKTKIAAKITKYFIEHEPNRQIICLIPKSLISNFIRNVKDVENDLLDKKISSDDIDSYVDKHYKFISLNSGTMYKTVDLLNKTQDEIEYEKKLGNFMDDFRKRSDQLENTLLIIDEAHNFFNGVANGSKNARSLYDLIMQTKNIKIIFLTGTPMINDPYELVFCFNMLRGKIYDELLFSENYDDFEKYFIDIKHKCIKNKDKFTNRIFGLTSYYGDLYTSNINSDHFPKMLPTIIEKVHMSEEQYATYVDLRIKEQDENRVRLKQNKSSRNTSSSSGSYRVKSRQACNYKFDSTDIKNLEVFSPKIAKLIDNIRKSTGLGIIYSQFVAGTINIIAKCLDAAGYTNIENDIDQEFKSHIAKQNRTYAILTGDVDIDKRKYIIDQSRDIKNLNGEVISLLLLSGALAEGTDLKYVRHVHIIEPFWNYARTRQVETRACRYNSHIDLPEKDRNVQTYIYLSTFPINTKNKLDKYTTDIELYNKSIVNMEIINSFKIALAESSFDCGIHNDVQKKIKCKMCSPTNEQLFHPSLIKDMHLPNQCQENVRNKIVAKKLELNGDVFYYDDKKIYYFDKKLNNYVTMTQDHPKYADIVMMTTL